MLQNSVSLVAGESYIKHAGIKNAKLFSKLPKPRMALHQILLLAPRLQDLIITGVHDGKRLSKTQTLRIRAVRRGEQ